MASAPAPILFLALSLPIVAPETSAAPQGPCSPAWGTLGTGFGNAVFELAWVDLETGAGPRLYAGGSFTSASGAPASRVARWSGSQWQPLGDGLAGSVYALAAATIQGSRSLYAGGNFGAFGIERVARWNGSEWVAVGAGLGPGSLTVFDLVEWDDGSGNALYAAGSFTQSGASSVSRLARWNGSTWSSVGGGLNGVGRAMAVWNDGTGEALYVVGDFTAAGGVPAQRVARWDGVAWQALGSGLEPGFANLGRALAVHNDGTGERLWVGGAFHTAGGLLSPHLASWDGQGWRAQAGQFSGVGLVQALASYTEATGTYLMIASEVSAGAPDTGLKGWDGKRFESPLLGGLNGNPWALAVARLGDCDTVVIGGAFSLAGGQSAVRVATWRGHPNCVVRVPGCFLSAKLATHQPPVIGGALTLQLTLDQVNTGFAALYGGVPVLGAGSCGLFVPGLGEFLLEPGLLLLVAGAAVQQSSANFVLTVPPAVALLGVELRLQSAALSPDLPPLVELSRALDLEIVP